MVQDFFHRQYQLIQPRERNLPPESRGKSCRIVILNRTPASPAPTHRNDTKRAPEKRQSTNTPATPKHEFPNKIRKDQTKTEVELTLTANSCVSLHHHAMAACQGAIRQRPSITRTIFDVLHGATCVTTWTLLVSLRKHEVDKIKSGSIPQPEPSSKRWLP